MTKNGSVAGAAARYHDIDWLRISAILFIFLYHAAKPFLDEPWHIKDTRTEPVLNFLVGLVDVWLMPLLFIISGMSIALSLRSRSTRQFAKERLSRLLIPLIFGIVVLSPFQVYVERLHYHQFDGSFLQFLPKAFDGLYLDYGGQGNFAWTGIHLWYLGVLLVYSFLLLPLFLTLSRGRWRQRLSRLGVWLEKPGLLLLAALPLMLLSTLNPSGLGSRKLGAWNFPIYLVLLIYGFLIIQILKGHKVIYRYRWLALFVFFVAGIIQAPLDGAAYGGLEFFIGRAARGLVMWSFVLFLLGLFYPLRQANSRLLRYASTMVLPFYILHQPIILAVGYFLVLPLNFPPLAKYGLLVVISFPIVLALYEFLVRRSNPLRILFGLKPGMHPKSRITEKERAIVEQN